MLQDCCSTILISKNFTSSFDISYVIQGEKNYMNGFVDCLCCAGSPPPRPLAYTKNNKQRDHMSCEAINETCKVENKWLTARAKRLKIMYSKYGRREKVNLKKTLQTQLNMRLKAEIYL